LRGRQRRERDAAGKNHEAELLLHRRVPPLWPLVPTGTSGAGLSAWKSVTGRVFSETGGADVIGANEIRGGDGIGLSGSPNSPAGAPGI
jgi:hypothetical protein